MDRELFISVTPGYWVDEEHPVFFIRVADDSLKDGYSYIDFLYPTLQVTRKCGFTSDEIEEIKDIVRGNIMEYVKESSGKGFLTKEQVEEDGTLSISIDDKGVYHVVYNYY